LKRLVCIATSLACAAAVLGQAPTPTPGSAPMPPVSERVEVSVTNIEVVVTDSKGNRVPGLTQNDFEVIQDGVPQKITNFYAVSGGTVFLEDGKSVALDSKEAQAELPSEVKARFILYIDNLNIQPINRNRMFKRLKEWVASTIGPNALAEVVTFNRSLKVRQKFTAEGGQVVNTLEQIELETGGATTIVGERRDALHKIDEAQSAAEALGYARQYSQSLHNDLQFAVDGIKTTLNQLAGVDGRKIFVYVSEGLPATVGLELYEAAQQKYGESASMLESFEFDMNSQYASIIQAANAQGVSIWAFDASGLTVDDSISAENRGYQKTRPNAFLTRTNLQAPLQLMAEQTGGMAAVNTNDWKQPLDELAKDFSNFYSLGYRTTRSAVDKPHSVEVVVKRKGLRARFRKGFVEKTPETRTSESVLASLFYSREDNPLGIHVAMGAQKPYKDNFVVPVRISVAIGKLGLVPVGDHYEGVFLVYVVARDSDDKQSDLAIMRQVVNVAGKDFATAQQKDFHYDFSMTVGPGAQRVAIAVRDSNTNQTSFYQKNLFISLLPKETKKAS
jgi:VWFA-related protein